MLTIRTIPRARITLVEDIEAEDYCPRCGEPLQPMHMNNGFNEPGAEHWEVVGYVECNCIEEES